MVKLHALNRIQYIYIPKYIYIYTHKRRANQRPERAPPRCVHTVGPGLSGSPQPSPQQPPWDDCGGRSAGLGPADRTLRNRSGSWHWATQSAKKRPESTTGPGVETPLTAHRQRYAPMGGQATPPHPARDGGGLPNAATPRHKRRREGKVQRPSVWGGRGQPKQNSGGLCPSIPQDTAAGMDSIWGDG